MKNKLMIAILVVMVLLCQSLAFAEAVADVKATAEDVIVESDSPLTPAENAEAMEAMEDDEEMEIDDELVVSEETPTDLLEPVVPVTMTKTSTSVSAE